MKRAITSLLVFVIMTMVGISAPAAQRYYSDRPEVREFIDGFAKEHDLNRAELLGMFRRAHRQQAVLDAMSRPAERALIWSEYKPIFVTDASAKKGAKFWQSHAEHLEKAQQHYGVPPEIIVAIIGVETRYGKSKGNHPVFDTLVTLGFDGESRTAFFRRELGEFLLLAKDERFDPFSVKGSYAGAMGIPQFIASSFRAYAVDYDGDGRRDLFANPADAIGSVANYFKRHGWRSNEMISAPVSIINKKAIAHAVGRGRKGLKPSMSIAELQKAGVEYDSSLQSTNPEQLAVLLEFENDDGAEYWLGMKNFYVITRYNMSSMYAMAVYQLSQGIKQHYNKIAKQRVSATVR